MKRTGNIFLLTIAGVYFLLDALFAAIAMPLAKWIDSHWVFARVRRWIRSLSPYPTLGLFLVPLIVLEPVKPVAAYLVGTGRVWQGLAILAIGEILKLVLVERLFSISRDKLMTIPAFAWAYGKYAIARDWLASLEAWQRVQRWSRIVRYVVHSYMMELRGTGGSRAIFQPR